MAVEGDHDGGRLMLLGVGDHLPNYLLVAKVNAVEDADRETYFAATRAELSRFAYDPHGVKRRA
jgi:hypothetical protein